MGPQRIGADAWIKASVLWSEKWGRTLCHCGHAAAPGADGPDYHEPNQGGRCRAPFTDCPCMVFRPRPCGRGGCKSHAIHAKPPRCGAHVGK